MGSATVQGQLWGALARDWTAYGEQLGLPLHGAALDAAHVTAGTRVLDAAAVRVFWRYWPASEVRR
jgi:hypothetical protein